MATLIDDATATRYFNEIDNAPEEDRQMMADSLIAWGNAKQEQEYNATDEHFSKLFTDDSYFEQEKQANAAVQESLDPDQTAKSAAIGAWLEHRLGRPIDTMSYQAERDSYAMANYGKKNLDDAQFFDFVRGEYDWQKQRTEAINDLQMQAVAKAINDSQLGQNRPFVDGMTEVFNEWQAKYPELVDGQNDAAFLSQGYKLYYDTINDLDTVRPQASKALSTLTAFTQGNATDEELQSLANDFVGAPPEDRQKIYKYVTLAAQAGQIDRSGLEQFAINMGQSFTRGFDFIPQGSLQMQEAGVNNWLESIRNGTQIWVPADGDLTKAVVGNAPAGAESDAWRLATVPEAETLIQSGQNVRESFKVVRELRNVAKTGVDPIRPVLEEDTFWGTAERGAYGLAGSIPLMGATAVNPYLGVLAYQATEYDRIMLENPDIDPQFAQGLALVEGAANAAIDRVQLKTLSGKLPMFGRYLDRIKSDGIRRTIKVGGNVVEQNLQEGVQDLIAPVLETAVAALREDMPDKDFSSLMDEWAGQRAETFFAVLPLALIGGGIATYQDIKNPSAELNATKLRQVGFDKEQVTFIQRANNPEEYTARIQMEWDKRTPENIEAGRQEIIAEMERAATPGENDARISETVAEDGSRRWVVTSPDGRELLQTQDQQAALEAVRQHSEAQMINERNTVADMVDYFRAQDPTNTATIEAPRTVQQELDRLTEAGDAKGIANLNERIRFAGIPEGADLTTYNILGEANVETTAEGVFRGVIKLRENSRPEDAFEEINHVFVRKAIAEGRVTQDQLRGWLTQTAEATGETYAAETETDIIENIAKIGMDYAAGRIEETSLPASFVDYIKRMLQVLKETMARALKLKDAFAAGKIDANFETFLAESVGLNQQTLADTVRDRAKTDIITDGGQMLMDFSIGSRASAVSNDTPALRAGNATIVSPTNFSIGAYHGTPHKVDKFSTEKIGTGEGAQAYGWGLYFAQQFDVAQEYKDVLSSNQKYKDLGISPSPRVKTYLENAISQKFRIQFLKDDLERIQEDLQAHEVKAIDSFIKYVEANGYPVNKGNLYTVDLDVEPEDLLDWDKPLSEQSPKVQAALAEMNPDYRPDSDEYDANEQGQMVYTRITYDQSRHGGVNPEMMASVTLNDFGIKGIRYLDGGSRNAPKRNLQVKQGTNGWEVFDQGQRIGTYATEDAAKSAVQDAESSPTYNYVVFDENLIKITEENGNRITMQDAQAVSTDTGATNYSIGKKDKEVVVDPDETTEPGTPAPDTGVEILDPDRDGEDIPWEPTNYSIGPRSLPEVFPTLDKKLFSKIKKETSTIAAIHIDRMKVGELMGIPLQGGMFYPSIVENLKAGVAWAFNAPNVARTVARRAAANGGYVKLVLMQEGNVIGNKTFTHVWFANLEKNISDGIISKTAALGELNRVRELFADHSDSKLSTGHNKKWKTLAEAKDAIISLPQQKRASTYFKKTKTETKSEGVKIAYQQLLSKKNTKLGMPDPITLVEQMEEPAFKGMPTGAIVGIIKIDPIKDSDPILTGEQAGVPTHLSYDYVLKGKPIAKMGKITVLDEAFPNTKNQILTQQHTDFPLEQAINYSIASQSQIDRVNRALGGMNRGPDERLKVYERARKKFSLLQAWNRDELQAMQETGADDTTIRRSQILQGLGELDAILSILPPEVRGRVGGYTKLASIAPHDVFKDGVKVSEVSGMNGALISAWMREGLNIGEAGKKVDFPPGYEAKENLATARADRAIADFFRDRIKKIDAEFEKVVAREYRSAILDLVKKSRPKAGDNNVRKSTLGAETQKLADMVQRATLMDEDAVAERMLQLEQTMATSENSADMVEEWGILNQFGDLKNRNSETLAQAYGWFKDQLQMGREAWRIKEEARIAENRERAKKTVEFIGGATAVDRFKDKTFMDRVSDWANHALLDHASFEQFVTALLPPDVAADFSERLRKADTAAQKAEIDQREGILNALRQGAKAAGTTTSKAMVMLKTEVPSAVRYLDGRKVKNTKLTIEQAEKIVRGEIDRGDLTDTDVRNLSDELAALPADTRKENITLKQVVYPGKEVRLPMTRGKAIQLLLSWNQPDVQDKMRREGWSEDSIADLRELTSDPVSQSMIAHAQELYGKGAAVVNPVYSRMFGMNMPQVKNYAPTRFLNAKDTKDIGLDGSPVATGTTPGFAKSRVSHSAKIAPEDALSVMQQHILTQAHWVNFAELAREYRSLINNPEIREAIKAKHGTGVLKTAELWADQMEQRGGNQSREAAWVNAILGSVIGGQSVASLGFNLKTLAMQLDNSVRFALALDTKQIMTAMSSPDQLIEDIKTVFESDALQTRLRGGATAETRYMFERFGGKPGTAAKVTEAAMSTINWVDTATTSFSAAIVYRANLNEALDAGMPESLARETALDAAAAAIYRFAQPVSFGQKSNVENSGNMFTKAFFLFMSDPRLKTAIMADAVRGLATGRGDKWTHIRRLVAVELMAVLSHVVASAYRDAFTDDEDEDIWGRGGFVRALALAPLQGFLFAGTMFDSVLSQLTGAGFFTPTQNPLLTVAQTGIRALKNADDILAFDDPDALLKEWNAIARTMAVAPAAAMPAVLLNAVKPIFGAASNAANED